MKLKLKAPYSLEQIDFDNDKHTIIDSKYSKFKFKISVSDFSLNSLKFNNYFNLLSDEEKVIMNKKREFGTLVHKALESFIFNENKNSDGLKKLDENNDLSSEVKKTVKELWNIFSQYTIDDESAKTDEFILYSEVLLTNRENWREVDETTFETITTNNVYRVDNDIDFTEKLEESINNPLLFGTVDLIAVCEKAKTIYIVDWKTGDSKRYKHLALRKQLVLYYYLFYCRFNQFGLQHQFDDYKIILCGVYHDDLVIYQAADQLGYLAKIFKNYQKNKFLLW